MKRTTAKHPPYPTRTHSHSEETASSSLLMRNAAKSFLLSLATGAILLLLFSLIAYFQADPSVLILPLGLAAVGLTGFLGGVFLVRLHKHSALICGLLNGTLVEAFLLLLSLFFSKHASGYSLPVALLIHAGFLLLSVLGAFLGLPKPEKKKPLKRRR